MNEMPVQQILEKLTKQFKKQKVVIKKAKKITFIGVSVTYICLGSQNDIIELISEIEKEWDFLLLHVKCHDESWEINIEYQIKSGEITTFLNNVKYRGKMIKF